MTHETKAYSTALLAAMSVIAATPASANVSQPTFDSSAALSTVYHAPTLSMDKDGQVLLGGLSSDEILEGAYGMSTHDVMRMRQVEVNLHCPRNTNCGDKCGSTLLMA